MNSNELSREQPPRPRTDSPGDPDRAHRRQRAFLAQLQQQLLAPSEAIRGCSEGLLRSVTDRSQEDLLPDVYKLQRAAHQLAIRVRDLVSASSVDGSDSVPGLGASLVLDLQAVRSLARHDILNNLHQISSYCGFLLEEVEARFLEALVPDLHKVRDDCKKCETVIDQLLTYSPDEVAPVSDDLRSSIDNVLKELESDLPPPDVDLAQGQLLVVDDNEYNRDVLARHLRDLGHNVAVADNGVRALELLQREAFDAVFLDILMPEMNGLELLKHLKAGGRLPHLPVIMVSAWHEMTSIVRCIEMGAEDFLSKPFDKVMLQARLKACLEKKRLRDRLDREKQRSDELLHVILPDEIVTELKATDQVLPRRYEGVAVLFADIVGFTSYCDKHRPEEVLPHLQELVQTWEEIALRHQVEKIKTIGDAFMAVAGLLKPVANPVRSCVECGLEMIAAAQGLPVVCWNLRVGIHCGPVIAGMLGRRQYSFDLWGDTVNTAARMESNGVPGHITLSEDAWEQIAGQSRGEPLDRDVRGKGNMRLMRFDGWAE
jgi:adenylate cyclase